PAGRGQARAARAADRARPRRAASPLLHELERERDRCLSRALDVARHGVVLERALEVERRALEVGGEAHVARVEPDLAQRRAQLDRAAPRRERARELALVAAQLDGEQPLAEVGILHRAAPAALDG